MKRREIIPVLALGGIALVAGLIWFAPWAGQRAPNVQLSILDGGSINLADFSGRPVMLQFWATSCVTCVAEMPELKALHRSLADDGLKLIGVAMSYDPPDQVARMTRERQLPYTIALDRGGRVARAFGNVQLTPTSVLIDPNGRIVWKRMGKLDFDDLGNEIRSMLNTAARS